MTWAVLLGVVAGAVVGVWRKQRAPDQAQAGALWAAGAAVAVYALVSIVRGVL